MTVTAYYFLARIAGGFMLSLSAHRLKTTPFDSGSIFYNGAPEAIRTPDPFLRREVLYPAELRVQNNKFGRNDGIRTRDLLVPNQAHYQAMLRPENGKTISFQKLKSKRDIWLDSPSPFKTPNSSKISKTAPPIE